MVRARGEQTIEFEATARIDTPEELIAFRHGGILSYVLRQLASRS
jgi:aconitate hydratase